MFNVRALLGSPLLLAILVVAVACAAEEATPVVIEKEKVVEVEKPVEVEVKEVVVTPTSSPIESIDLTKLEAPEVGFSAQFSHDVEQSVNGEQGDLKVISTFQVLGVEEDSYTVAASARITESSGPYTRIQEELAEVGGLLVFDSRTHVLGKTEGDFPEDLVPFSLGSGFKLFGEQEIINLGDQWQANELSFTVSEAGVFNDLPYLKITMTGNAEDSVFNAEVFLTPQWPFIIRLAGDMIEKIVDHGDISPPEVVGEPPEGEEIMEVPSSPSSRGATPEQIVRTKSIVAELANRKTTNQRTVPRRGKGLPKPLGSPLSDIGALVNLQLVNTLSQSFGSVLLTAWLLQAVDESNYAKDWYVVSGQSTRIDGARKGTYFHVSVEAWSQNVRPQEVDFDPPGGTGAFSPLTFVVGVATQNLEIIETGHPGTWQVDFINEDSGSWKARRYVERQNFWWSSNWGKIIAGIMFQFGDSSYSAEEIGKAVYIDLKMDTKRG